MIQRSDIRELHRVPKGHKEFLLKLGGVNPFAEPMLRLVVAEERLTTVGGTFNEYREGSSLQDRGGYNLPEEIEDKLKITFAKSSEQPQRVFTGLKQVPKYTHESTHGWLLEKWYPASNYGTEAEWLSHTGKNGVPLLGPYPASGEYEPITGCVSELPSFTALEMAYQMHLKLFERMKAEGPRSREDRLKWRTYLAEQAKEEFERKAKEENKYLLKDFSKPVWSSSLRGGRLRTKIENKLRSRGINIGHAGN